MKRSTEGEVYHLTNKKIATMMKAMLDKIEWEPLPDGWEDHTVFVGGRPIPVAEFIQNYPSAERRQGDDE